MRVQLHPETSNVLKWALRTIAIAFLLASLMIGTAWPMSASGPGASPAVPEFPLQKLHATSTAAA